MRTPNAFRTAKYDKRISRRKQKLKASWATGNSASIEESTNERKHGIKCILLRCGLPTSPWCQFKRNNFSTQFAYYQYDELAWCTLLMATMRKRFTDDFQLKYSRGIHASSTFYLILVFFCSFFFLSCFCAQPREVMSDFTLAKRFLHTTYARHQSQIAHHVPYTLYIFIGRGFAVCYYICVFSIFTGWVRLMLCYYSRCLFAPVYRQATIIHLTNK